MNNTPMANRLTIGLFGRRNTGKSSLINALTGQDISLVSKKSGTTTDPVYKAMELAPLGPIVLIDTAGLDDVGEIGKLRVEKTYEVLRKCDLAIIVTDEKNITRFEIDFINEIKKSEIPYLLAFNKFDIMNNEINTVENENSSVYVSAKTGFGVENLKSLIINKLSCKKAADSLVKGLIKAGEIAVLVTPIDKSAPKGRLILPQQQTIRDILDLDAVAVISKETKLQSTLKRLKEPPSIVITDSQVFKTAAEITPYEIPLTSFSILFARQKSDLAEMVKGVMRINKLTDGDRVLIAEGCSHHKQDDDIATVKVPEWIRKITGKNISFTWSSGSYYPKGMEQYSVIVHCGGCMLNANEMRYRVQTARRHNICVTNYGILAAHALGILPRALKPFPDALHTFKQCMDLENAFFPAMR